MDSVQNIQLFLQSLNGSIDELENKLEPIITKSLEEVIAPIESPMEKIQVYNNYSYVLLSIIYAYLKSSGVNTDSHPIMKELDRVKGYMKRYKELEQKMNSEKIDNVASAKEYLQQTLGTKSVTENTVGSDFKQPSISSSNFKGTHKKFE